MKNIRIIEITLIITLSLVGCSDNKKDSNLEDTSDIIQNTPIIDEIEPSSTPYPSNNIEKDTTNKTSEYDIQPIEEDETGIPRGIDGFKGTVIDTDKIVPNNSNGNKILIYGDEYTANVDIEIGDKSNTITDIISKPNEYKDDTIKISGTYYHIKDNYGWIYLDSLSNQIKLYCDSSIKDTSKIEVIGKLITYLENEEVSIYIDAITVYEIQ